MRRAIIKGVGSYLPARSVGNDELAVSLDTSDEWIRTRSGIVARHIAAEGELTSDLATYAARAALDDAGVSSADIDMIIVATTTPDLTFPSCAAIVQDKLGIAHGAAFDIQAVCSGFIYGLSTGKAMIESGQADCILIIGAETMTRILDWEDRSTAVLFGDGAGAVVVAARDNVQSEDSHIIDTHLRCDGKLAKLLYVDDGPSSGTHVGKLRMAGAEIFRSAVVKMSETIVTLLERTGYTIDDIDWFVPHQANIRIITALATRLNLPPEKTITTISEHANTSAASIPLALDTAIRDGRIKRGDLVMCEAMGGGLTWGSALIRW